MGFAPLGYHPTLTREAAEWMPKSRYAIMRRYMPLVGTMGLDMMLRTCTVQVNLDFADEADMRRKLRVSLALQPLATALFANSPFKEGRPNGLLSNRAHVWTDVDPDRTGMPAVMFEDGFGFERLRRLAAGRADVFHPARRPLHRPGRPLVPRLHGRAACTRWRHDRDDRRLRRPRHHRVHRRAAEAVPGNARRGCRQPAMMLAQSALWVGLLYDDAALAAAESLVRCHRCRAFTALRAAVPRSAMATPWRRGTLRDLARDVLAIARDGLRARSASGGFADEASYLDPLDAIAAGGPTQAEHWLTRYNGAWQGNVTNIFDEAAI